MVLYNPDNDEALLNSLGYKQEFKREYSLLTLWALSFSILGVANLIVQLSDSIIGGSVTMVWGWLVPGILILSVGMALGELGSAYPTSGGLYFYTYKFAPAGAQRWASFLCAWSNTIGLIAGLSTANYGIAEMIMAAVNIGTGGDFVGTKYESYGIMIAVTVVICILGLLPSRYLSLFQLFGCFLQVLLLFIMCVAVPVGAARKGNINSAKFVFTETTNLTEGWSYGMVFCISWLTVAWTIGAFDSCIHLSEEASNATRAVPYAIISSVSMAVFLGAILEAVLAACILNEDFARLAASSSGQPFAVIFNDALGEKWTIAIISLMVLSMLITGSSILTSVSRQTYSVARDGVLPMSKYLRKLNGLSGVPFNAIIFDCIICSIFELLVLIDATAANALFSLYVSSNSLSWLLPIVSRLLKPKTVSFEPGIFYLGHIGSAVNSTISVLFLIFIISFVTVVPLDNPVEADTMNYTCLINPCVWLGALAYYFADAHKWFKGPKSTLGDGVSAVFEGIPKESESDVDCHIKLEHTKAL